MILDNIPVAKKQRVVHNVQHDNLDNNSATKLFSTLLKRLPGSWDLKRLGATHGPDAMISAPDGRTIALQFKWAARLEPRAAQQLSRDLRSRETETTTVVASPFLSPRTRQELEAAGISYVDLTGNVRIVLDEPGLFINTMGEQRNPNRAERPLRRLRGPKASRVVRYLVDFRKVPGVRAIAEDAGVDPGYVSRLLDLLDREALVERDNAGRVVSARWDELLRRWAEDAPLSTRGERGTFIEPRGLQHLLDSLRKKSMKHAVTGSMAAAKLAPAAPARLAMVYVDEMTTTSRELGLRETELGANAWLIVPKDSFVFERSVERDGVQYAAASQIAADLLTSPGRGPAEADELIRWMKEHERGWRG